MSDVIHRLLESDSVSFGPEDIAKLVAGFESTLANLGLKERNDPATTEINAGLANSTIKARLADLGSTALVGSPADFGKLIADETEKWGKVIRAANIKAE